MAARSQLAKWDQQYVWHPFTQMNEWMEEEPLVIERGKGPYLYDTKGKKYIDGVSSLWVNVHGHRVPEIDRAIEKQLKKIAHTTLLGLASPPSILLAKRLVEISPKGLKKVFYSDNGSTAVEIALKMAFQYWQQVKPTRAVPRPKHKTKFITFKNAYHGDTIGSVSVGGIDLFHKIYKPLLFKSIQVPIGDVQALEKALKAQHKEVAALIMEPLIQGAAGMRTQPPGFLRAVRRLCTRYNVLMIADEVATGFGRTGKMFACDHENVSPDLMCVAKGVTGGYLPLAATLTTQKIFDAFLGRYDELKTFFHGHTYTGNALACAAALANIELMERPAFWKRVRKNTAALKKELAKIRKLPSVQDVRQCGMMVGIELRGGGTARLGHKVCMEMRKHGVILRPLGNVVVMMPPSEIPTNEIRRLSRSVQSAIQ